ncbi:DnaD domain protein [Oceanobacillus saliphilus]|uniref:DnaD domain protein n=1 Tax=Oceanobacillus saliphilus TaxID=2925834 RepID=UPI00201DCE7B|nr:DnaD domain protein [Oceanobacillus saliphilus]
MNYIKQVNAFYIHLETNPLSASAANLWHVLMHVNNRTGWRQEFTVAMSVLCCKANLTESTFKRARKELQEKGYIHVKSQGGNRAASYHIVSLDGMIDQENEEIVEVSESMGRSVDYSVKPNMDHSMDRSMNCNMNHNMNYSLDHNVSRNADPLFKQNKTKQNNTTNTPDAIQFFQENFDVMSPYVVEDIIHWMNDLDESLILYAMKRALERGRANWGYVKAILKAWVKKGIFCVEDAMAEEAEYRSRRKYSQESGGEVNYNDGGKGAFEVVPDWFRERKREEKMMRGQMQGMDRQGDLIELKEGVERRLAEYRGG